MLSALPFFGKRGKPEGQVSREREGKHGIVPIRSIFLKFGPNDNISGHVIFTGGKESPPPFLPSKLEPYLFSIPYYFRYVVSGFSPIPMLAMVSAIPPLDTAISSTEYSRSASGGT